jgi:hypothetical protein
LEVEGESLGKVFQLLHKQQHGCGGSLGGIFDLVSTFWPECVNSAAHCDQQHELGSNPTIVLWEDAMRGTPWN